MGTTLARAPAGDLRLLRLLVALTASPFKDLETLLKPS